MSVRRELFSWDGDDEHPIPLDDRSSPPSPTDSAPIVDQAEGLVREPQDAIAREDADRAIALPVEVPEPKRRGALPLRPGLVHRPLPKHAQALLLAAGCLLVFAHGWTTGHRAHASSAPGSCDAAHCRPDVTGDEWKEDQRP